MRDREKKTRPRNIVVIVKQRVIGKTNGSSAYLLSLCEYLAKKGDLVTLIWPNPKTFGRWPLLKLTDDLNFARDLRWRGAYRIGRYVFCLNPLIYAWALVSYVDLFLYKRGISSKTFIPRAESALLSKVTKRDQLFVEAYTKDADAIIVDYAFGTNYLSSVQDKRIPNAVLMHDLFSSRPGQFKDKQVTDNYGSLSCEEEMQSLDRAGAVIAIQKDEALIVKGWLPDKKIILAPMATQPQPQPFQGKGHIVLFVGSNAAPNVIGINWFLKDIWPIISAARPDIVLNIAGSVCGSIATRHPNVRLLGVVPDLRPLYEEAGVVISPLTTGSGLKIKLIEALAHGKSIVATEQTLQGVKHLVADALLQADDVASFAEATLKLLNDEDLRKSLLRKAVSCVTHNFSEEACFAEVAHYLHGGSEIEQTNYSEAS